MTNAKTAFREFLISYNAESLNYIPYALDSKIQKTKKNGEIEEISLREEIFNRCKYIYFDKRNESEHLDSLDKYSEGSFLDESEKDFINRYFNLVAKALDEGEEEFNAATHWAFSSKEISLHDKAQALSNLVYSGNMEFHLKRNSKIGKEKTLQETINGLKDNEIFQGILQKFNSDEYKNPCYNNHYTKEGKAYEEEDDDEVYSQIEKDYRDENLSQPAWDLMRLFDEHFSNSPKFEFSKSAAI